MSDDRRQLYICIKNVQAETLHSMDTIYTNGQLVMFYDSRIKIIGEKFYEHFEPVSFEDLFPEMMQQFDKIISTIEFHMGQDYEGK